MTFHIITLFPKAFDSYLGESILKRAIENKKIEIRFYNPRDFAENKWRRIDRAPYGGGPGMVIEALPVIRAIESAIKKLKIKKKNRKSKIKIIWTSPGGNQLTNTYAAKMAKSYSDIIIVCGRYEGIDARVGKVFSMDEISIGPFVLTGGELPAMVIIDATARQRKGVLGTSNSLEERRVLSNEVYTRPEVFEYRGKKYHVPKILLSGHHGKIEKWKERRGKGRAKRT
ncbi:tRNA (guanosine(37)-N1)-methyltransferase TrmD [Patescibacteria group bacterium]|nr:MAG: tRNA (guanosine(37)-N1)-methyltransferase TrmD [Patescibacteria group bacterium]